MLSLDTISLTISLPGALLICQAISRPRLVSMCQASPILTFSLSVGRRGLATIARGPVSAKPRRPTDKENVRIGLAWHIETRTEEHTTELQSPGHLLWRLLLGK